jgi:hypothetical protein
VSPFLACCRMAPHRAIPLGVSRAAVGGLVQCRFRQPPGAIAHLAQELIKFEITGQTRTSLDAWIGCAER